MDIEGDIENIDRIDDDIKEVHILTCNRQIKKLRQLVDEKDW